MTQTSRSYTHAVECNQLRKTFNKGRVIAVNNVSLNIEDGTLFGLIGADGAGKTSLIKILATLCKPDKGTARVLGCDTIKDFRALRHYIGYMPGKFSLYGDLSVRENLKVFATLYNTTIEANYDLYGELYDQLAPFANRAAAKLSGGMKQKLALCCALVHRPHILLLDEPTTGVDPVSRRIFWDILSRIKKEEKLCIIVSTPYMDEAFRCDRVALMKEGEIISEDTPQALVDSYSYKLWGAVSSNKPLLLKKVRTIEGVTSAFTFGESIHLTFDEQITSSESITHQLICMGLEEVNMHPIAPSIEDYFLAMTKEKEESTETLYE